MALVFVATIAGRWFVRHRGVVTGVLTAAGATGQLVFLPSLAAIAGAHGWRAASLTVSAAALAVVPLVLLFVRDHPADVGLAPFGSTEVVPAPPRQGGAASRALAVLRDASRSRPFWLLAGGFAICGASTNGLVATHLIPASHDHGMPTSTAAGLLALIGVFDIVGTIASGWLTDRYDGRVLLVGYYTLRGLSLLILPWLIGASAVPSMLVFIVVYGLDWVATVPPTIALCRQYFGEDGPIVFGWVFAAHQVGAAVAAAGAGYIRDFSGDYDLAWITSGVLCFFAAVMSVRIARSGRMPGIA
jgi:predicted MFS family arabinose efflux permease